MNASIKRRQTLLVNWLAKVLNCKPITIAQTGSYYTEFNTQYTGKSVIRISDHLSGDRTYIHVILNPLNTSVSINYKNFIWNGNFDIAKHVLYTLIMSKAMTEISNPIPSNTVPIVEPKKETVSKEVIKKEENIIFSKGCVSTTHPIHLTNLSEEQLKKIQEYLGKKKYEKALKLGYAYFTSRQTTSIKLVSKGIISGAISKDNLLKLSDPLKKEVCNWLHVSSIEELPDQSFQFTKNQLQIIKSYL